MFIALSESRWQELKKIETGARPAGKRNARASYWSFQSWVGAYDDGFVWQLLKAMGKRKRKP